MTHFLQAGAMGCLGNLWGGAVSPDLQLSELTSQNLSISVREATFRKKRYYSDEMRYFTVDGDA